MTHAPGESHDRSKSFMGKKSAFQFAMASEDFGNRSFRRDRASQGMESAEGTYLFIQATGSNFRLSIIASDSNLEEWGPRILMRREGDCQSDFTSRASQPTLLPKSHRHCSVAYPFRFFHD